MPLDYTNVRDPGVGAEVWISAVIGLLCVIIGRTFAIYLFTTLTGGTYHTNVTWMTGPRNGQEVSYPELEGFTMLNDAGVFSFGVALLLEAVLIGLVYTGFRQKRALVYVSFGAALLATLFNAFVAVRLLGANTTPIISVLILAIGGYMCFYQWKILQSLPKPLGA